MLTAKQKVLLKVLIEAIKIIQMYKNTPAPGYDDFSDNKCRKIKDSEELVLKELVSQIVKLRGYIIYKVRTWKQRKKPVQLSNGRWTSSREFTHYIKARSKDDVHKILRTKYKNEPGLTSIEIVG